MTRRTRAGCAGAALIAAVLLAWYQVRYAGPWVARTAALQLDLPEVPHLSTIDLWRDRSDPSRLAVSWFESGSASPSILLIDRSGQRTRQSLSVEQLRARFERYDEAAAANALRVELHGVDIPRPKPYLFRFPGPGGPGVLRQHSLFGTIEVVDRNGHVLLSQRVINGDRLPSPFELARVAPGGEPLALIDRGPRTDWQCWLFGGRR